ncbi:MAG: Ig-like domain-containing protein [Dehalococcoidia bacterium]|nr:Ig-like domain-containing protein [Dehalococcoidia bacterium]
MKTTLRLLLLAATVIGLVALLPGSAMAQAAPKNTSITVAPIDQPKGKPAIIAATLKDAAGSPLGGVPLRFYVETDAFGPRLMKVGEGVTDVSGTAAVAFKSTWLGQNKVTVVFPGNATLAASQANGQFNAVGPVAVHKNAELAIKSIRDWAPMVAFGLVIVVWATLLFVLFRTFRVMLGGPRERSATEPRAVTVQNLPADER